MLWSACCATSASTTQSSRAATTTVATSSSSGARAGGGLPKIPVPNAADLWNDPARLARYDIVALSCNMMLTDGRPAKEAVAGVEQGTVERGASSTPQTRARCSSASRA